MTKEEWVYLIIDNLAGSDESHEQKRRFHPQMIEKYLDAAFTALVAAPEPRGEFAGSWKLDALTKVYCVKCECDNKRKKSYITLPAKVVPLGKASPCNTR